MTVSAVGQRDHSHLNTIIKSTVVGTTAGYAMKYLWPVTKQETSINDKREILNACRKHENRAKAREIKQNKILTPAQDVFVKAIDRNDKDMFKSENIAKVVLELGGENSSSGKEYRTLIRNLNEAGSKTSRLWFETYLQVLKNIRPVVPFLVAGAGIGFLTGFTHNVLKTDA